MICCKNDNPICVFDSGIGGLYVLFELIKNMPNENYIFLSDKKNLPFGNKSKEELLNIAKKNIEKLNGYNPKVIVIACNTLSVVLGKEMQKFTTAPVILITPPIKKYQGKNACVLCTPMTAKYLQVQKSIDVYSLEDMANRVETGITVTKDASKIVMPQIIDKISGKYDVVILGCTHYSLIKSELKKHMKPHIIIDGCFTTVKKVKNIVNYQQNTNDSKFGRIVFIGGNKLNNKVIYDTYIKKF